MNVRGAIRRLKRRLNKNVVVFDAEEYWRLCWSWVLSLRLMEAPAGSLEVIDLEPPPFPADLPSYAYSGDRTHIETEILRRIDAAKHGYWVDVGEMFFNPKAALPKQNLKLIPGHWRWHKPAVRKRPRGMPDRIWFNDDAEWQDWLEQHICPEKR
jgi:hypothetical protein